MAFDYTNFLETALQGNNGDFLWYDRAGVVGPVAGANVSGEWCEENGSTTSSGTGPASNPAGRAGFIYSEASGPVATTVWRFQRDTVFDTTQIGLTLNLIYNLNIETTSEFHVEYATVASPNETTDWTILETIVGTLTDAWISDSFDFTGVTQSTTFRIRIRCDFGSQFTNDLAFSTWNEVGVDLNATEQEGFRWRNDDGSESAATWRQLQDVDDTVGKEANIRLRTLVDNSGNPGSVQATLQYKRDDEAASEWRDV